MLRFGCFLAAAFAFAATPKLELRNANLWLVNEGQETQLTRDGKPKGDAALSPAHRQIAYVEGSMTVVVVDTDGRRIRAFQPAAEVTSPSPCNSIVSLAWRSEKVVAAECHVNPSVSEYVETDVATGRTIRDLWGYDFVPSPDGRAVAHVGAYPHFSPPFAQSNYLQFDDTVVYPLAPGTRPAPQKGMASAPDVVQVRGRTYSGIHEFVHEPVWSRDSKRVALVDCTYDWTASGVASQEQGQESNRRCSLAVASRDGQSQIFSLAGVPRARLPQAAITWSGTDRVTLRAGGVQKVFTLR